jgi:hypothetical protein
MVPGRTGEGAGTGGWGTVLFLAGLFTLLNAVKPLHLDDTAYSCYAHQFAQTPFDPYGFEIFWYQQPQPAGDVLAPPLLPYWWSLAIRLFGERPVLWKLWLFPFALLFVAALRVLFQRCVRGLEAPLLWMTVLSPAFLPSLNLMLDVPALALALGALALFLRACKRCSLAGAVWPGLLGGLAMQTKYTGLLAPAAIMLYALLHRRWTAGILAVAVAAGVFAAWECFLLFQYGQSHFLHHLGERHTSLGNELGSLLPLLLILGGVFPAGGLLGLAALGVRGRALLAAGIFVALGYVALALVPEAYGTFLTNPTTGDDRLSLRHVIFGINGLAGIVIGALLVGRLCHLGGVRSWRALARSFCRRLNWFLVLWLGLEVAGYVVLSPFPAVRRVLGIVVVVTLLAGRLAARTCRHRDRQVLVQTVAVGSILLGLLFYGLDVHAAWAQQRLARAAAHWVRAQHTGGTVWYVGHWGFQYYAERRGMRPVTPQHSRLRPSDWLVIPEAALSQQCIQIGHELEPVAELEMRSEPPLRTVSCFYTGRTPLEHHEGPGWHVTIWRVLREHTPAAPEGR